MTGFINFLRIFTPFDFIICYFNKFKLTSITVKISFVEKTAILTKTNHFRNFLMIIRESADIRLKYFMFLSIWWKNWRILTKNRSRYNFKILFWMGRINHFWFCLLSIYWIIRNIHWFLSQSRIVSFYIFERSHI